jgi:hypothetical protein
LDTFNKKINEIDDTTKKKVLDEKQQIQVTDKKTEMTKKGLQIIKS